MLLKPSNITYMYIHMYILYDNSGHGNDDGKVNYVADNKMPQQMAFYGIACCLHRCQIVSCFDILIMTIFQSTWLQLDYVHFRSFQTKGTILSNSILYTAD